MTSPNPIECFSQCSGGLVAYPTYGSRKEACVVHPYRRISYLGEMRLSNRLPSLI